MAKPPLTDRAPWPLPPDTDTPPVVCGDPVDERGAVVALPHRYHARCYAAFHAAMNDKVNLHKTIIEIRALVAAKGGGG
jgi:hypothetical protein